MSSLFADIPNYEGLYKVSSDGYVVSLPRKGTFKAEHILLGGRDQKGYRIVTLSKNAEQKTFRLHRLVAEAFVPNPNGLPEINHKDENKENNAADNLEWCDRGYNVRYGGRTQKTRKRVDQFSLDGVYIKTFDGISEDV